ncbi:MAG TPA: ABC transporter permease [Acidimicrobiales bacterium]|nr:ABC transporter permease [Acidimicrobiales bacterium]
MARFLVRRLALGIFVIWMVTVLVFIIFFVGPGPADLARRLAGREASPLQVAQVANRLHLKDPTYLQYWHFIDGILHGNLGYSYIHGQPVTTVIKEAFPITLSLAVGAAIIWLVLGVLSGVVSAVKRGSLIDRSVTTVALFFYSVPVFVLGLILLYVFYYQLTIHGVTWFPGSGYTPFTQNPFDWFRGLVLPWVSLALISAATYTRLTRSSMLEVMGEDYIRTARAKGLLERRVIYRHSLRSALTPVVSQFGIDVGVLLGGAILTEYTFGMPGLGYTAVHAIEQQDLPVVIGIVLVATTAVVVANILVDIGYAMLDPRVRLH